MTKIRVTLTGVVDLRDPVGLGLTLDDLTSDFDWSMPHDPALTQQLGYAALVQGVEGLLVPSASLIDSNLVILIDNVSRTSTLEVVDAIDPKLYVYRA